MNKWPTAKDMKRKIKKAEAGRIYTQVHCSERCIFLKYCCQIHVCDIYLHACTLVCMKRHACGVSKHECMSISMHMACHKHVYVNTGMCVATISQAWRSEDNLGCWSLLSVFFEAGVLFPLHPLGQLAFASKDTQRDCPISLPSCHRSVGLRMCVPLHAAFVWVLVIQTQVLMLG